MERVKNMKPKISVVFPIYNNEKYLKRCIQSVTDQTLKDIELILIDDGSTDNAPAILDRFAESDERICVVHKENEGSAAGRNLGLDMAEGEYIAFVESDDFIAPDMYEKLYERAKKTEADIVKCGFYYCTADKKEEYLKYYNIAEENEVFDAKEKSRIFQFHPCIWAGLYRREFLDDNGLRFLLTPRASYSDYSWMMMTYAYAKKITVYHHPFYFYTYDNPESSYLKAGELYRQMFFHAKESNRILRECGIFESVKEDIAIRCYSACVHSAYHVNPELRYQCFCELREVFLDIYCEDFEYRHFGEKKRYLVDLVLRNEYETFYDLLFQEYMMYDPEDLQGKRLVLFGAGKCGKSYRIQLKRLGIPIIKWIDNNPNPQTNIELPNCVKKLEYDAILVAIANRKVFCDMKEQLLSLGVPENRIVWKLPVQIR